MAEQLAVGIDLGSTYSCIGLWRDDRVQIITNQEGQTKTPSYVSYSRSNVLVGKPAQNQLLLNPSNTIYDMKLLIGNINATDCIKENENYWTFKVVCDKEPVVELNVDGKLKYIKPEEVTSQVLIKLKKAAEDVAQQPIKNIVLTVPAYFDEHQKKATIKAADLADLNVLELISEPSAAAYAYEYNKRHASNLNLLVFDFGGRTLDVAIVKVKNGNFDVIAIDRDTKLGGRDFDNVLMDHFKNLLKERYRKCIISDKAHQKLLSECTNLKHELTSHYYAGLYLGEIFPEIEEKIGINRTTFNKICFNLFHRIEMVIHETLKKAVMTANEIDEVILVGGSSKMPGIKDLLLKIFPTKLSDTISLDEILCYGATIRAQMINLEKINRSNNKKIDQLSVGIDLGTTFSCIGLWRNNEVQIIKNQQGQMRTPSYVSYTKDGVVVGNPAQRQLPLNPSNTIYDMKRLIGNKNATECIEKNGKYWTFKVRNIGLSKKRGNPDVVVEINENGQTRLIKPEEVSSQILKKLKQSAEDVAQQSIEDIVLTVPAYFDEHQKNATIKAAELAGLNILELISEPSAAAYAYGYDQGKSNTTIMVFDLGGGTLDVVITQIKDGLFDVIAIGGDTQLGGRDFDNALIDYFVTIIERKHKRNISKNFKIQQKLLKECTSLKHSLSFAEESNLCLGELFPGIDEDISINRSTFNKICFNLFHQIENVITGTLKEANVTPDLITEIVLVGGSSRIPEVKELLLRIFPGTRLNFALHPDEAIAYGATLRATQINHNSVSNIKLNESNAKRVQGEKDPESSFPVNPSHQKSSSNRSVARVVSNERYYDCVPDESSSTDEENKYSRIYEYDQPLCEEDPLDDDVVQPSNVDTGLTAIALFDYETEEDDEISFNVHDIITEIEEIDVGWWRGACKGRYGLFPANYVQLNE